MFTVSQHLVRHNTESDTTERRTLTHTTVSQRSKILISFSEEYLITWKNVYYEDEGRKGGHKNGYSVWSPFCFSKNSMNEKKSLGENIER